MIGLELGAAYLPGRLVLSPESLTVAFEIAALSATAWLLGTGVVEDWEASARCVAVIAANVLGVGWISLEARAYVLTHHPRRFEIERTLALLYSAVWAGYAAVTFALGIVWRRRGARLIAVTLFGVTLSKMVLNDVWLLNAAQRAMVFVGVGGLLIGCSLAYHRFRELVLGPLGGSGPLDR
ncbi:MAG TPA: DUF2339 domain-containing protein [Actinomycetota bacterium]